MKTKKVYISIALLILSCIAINNSFAQSSKEIIPKRKYATAKSDAFFDNIQVSLVIDTSQTKSISGIKAILKIKNQSKDSLNIYNVMDLLHISLFNDSNRNVAINNVSKIFIHSRKEFQYNAFSIDKLLLNSQIVGKIIDNERFLTIPANGTYEIFFSIRKIVRSPIIKLQDPTNVIELPSGIYKLSVFMSIIPNPRAANAQGSMTESLSVPTVTIKYGVK